MKNIKIIVLFIFTILFLRINVGAQNGSNGYKLPGKGLQQHDFVYVGEWDMRKPNAQSLFVVRDGKIVFHYSIPQFTATGSIQEFDDVTMLSNGNIVYACMSGAGIITPEKNIIWQYTCAPGTETHSCQPIGTDSVLMVLNGPVGKVLIFNTATNKLLKEIVIPTASTSPHGQFRHVRWTQNKTIMDFMRSARPNTNPAGLMSESNNTRLNLSGQKVRLNPTVYFMPFLFYGLIDLTLYSKIIN